MVHLVSERPRESVFPILLQHCSGQRKGKNSLARNSFWRIAFPLYYVLLSLTSNLLFLVWFISLSSDQGKRVDSVIHIRCGGSRCQRGHDVKHLALSTAGAELHRITRIRQEQSHQTSPLEPAVEEDNILQPG